MSKFISRFRYVFPFFEFSKFYMESASHPSLRHAEGATSYTLPINQVHDTEIQNPVKKTTFWSTLEAYDIKRALKYEVLLFF